MSRQQPRHPDEPNPSDKSQTENYTDLENLHARPLGGHSYVVASERNGSETAYEVDIGTLSCPCEDMEYNNEGHEICAHLFKAILVAPDALEWNSMAAHDLATNMAKLESVVNRMEGNAGNAAPTAGTTTTESAGGAADGSPSSGSGTSTGSVEGTLEAVRGWLDDTIAPSIHDALDVREQEHGGERGVAIEADYREISDSQKETFKSAIKSLDGVEYHVGFNGACDSCGVEDGDFWYHFPVGWRP